MNTVHGSSHRGSTDAPAPHGEGAGDAGKNVGASAPASSGKAREQRELIAALERAMNNASDGVTLQDRSGRWVYANEAAAALCGFPDARSMMLATADEVARMGLEDAQGNPVAPEALPGPRALRDATPERMLVRIPARASGSRSWATVCAHAIASDSSGDAPSLAMSIWHDATNEQRYRDRARLLAEASARLASSLDYCETIRAVAHALVPELADWCTVYLIEDGTRSTLAFAHADPAKVAETMAFRNKYPPEYDERSGVAKVIRTGVPELYADLPDALLEALARDEDHLRDLKALGLSSAMVVPILVGGKAEGTLNLISTGSGRRYDQHDLELATEIGFRAGNAIENARAYRAAKLAVRARDEFLAVAGHELRTPLAALTLQLETLQIVTGAGAALGGCPGAVARVERSLSHAQRVARVVDGLMDVAHVAGGRLELFREDVDVGALVRDTCERFAEDAARAGSPLTVSVSGSCVMSADPHRLEEVISNLLSNAMKFGGHGPIAIACEGREEAVVVRIRDHGIGLAERDRERIFRRFERAVAATSYPGLGLGLWISRELVRAHGGSLEVTSKLGEGSTFTVTLPR